MNTNKDQGKDLLHKTQEDNHVKKEALKKIVKALNKKKTLKLINMKTLKITFLILFTFIISSNVNAQWTEDTDVNTLVVNSEGGDMQAIGTSEGLTYVVFWEVVAAPTNYELRLQVLDVDGNQTLGDNGILISNTVPMSTSTVTWTVNIDSNDNLYVGVTGTGGGEPAYAFKLDTSGVHLWGVDGVNVGSGYVVTILPLSSGEAIVSWFQSGQAVMQNYDASGSEIWASNQPIENGSSNTVPASFYELSDGGFISIFHSITSGINSILYSQRFSDEGEPQWASPTQISDNSTQWNIPYFGLQDGDVVYYGYKGAHSNRFDSYLQRLNPDGTLPWGINGSDFDTNQTDYEMETRISFEDGSDYIWSTCTYTNTNQSEKGEYIQKFDKESGARMFTDQAKVIFPIGSEKVHAGFLHLDNDLPLILIKEGIDNGATPTSLHALKLDENGDFAWAEETRPMATYAANKARIQFTKPINSQSVTVFIEDKGDGSKIYAQNFTEEILSINDNVIENDLFFINPISNNWEVKSNDIMESISIFNVLGQNVLRNNNVSSKEILIDTQAWRTGVYILEVITQKGKITKRIIKN